MESNNTKPLLDNSFFEFIENNRHEDVMRLRLRKRVDVDFPMDLAITQIEIRKKRIEHKLPTWAAMERVVFPSLLSTEQCSSEVTARYKSRLVVGDSLCDLTGGMGVDTFFMSQKTIRTLYIEQNELYCQMARHNFDLLGAKNIEVCHADCCEFLSNSTRSFDTIFIDPARRGKSQERLFALADCEPDVLSMFSLLRRRCRRLIIKMSPMVDITQLRQELSVKFDLYILSVRNECKELLAVIDTETCDIDKNNIPMNITCVLLDADGDYHELAFSHDGEYEASCAFATSICNYMYEPDVALLKAGVFKSITERFDVAKLSKNSHLYTSDTLINNFPGRAFRVLEVLPFSSGMCRQFATQYPSCNITTRNFPLSAVELRKRLKVHDGGDVYLLATSDVENNRLLIMCNKI